MKIFHFRKKEGMMNFLEVSAIRSSLNSLTDKAIETIKKNLNGCVPEEKKKLYKRIYDSDILLAGANFFSELEDYYKKIIDTVAKNKTGWDEYLPSFLIRCGYSLLAQNKFDEAFSYLLQSYKLGQTQDAIKSDPDFDNFINKIQRLIYPKLCYHTCFKTGNELFNEIPAFLNYFNLEDQLYLFDIFLKFDLHSSIIKKGDNLSSRMVLFSRLGDLCVFIESLLRKEFFGDSSLQKRMLLDLIHEFYSYDKGSWYDYFISDINRKYVKNEDHYKISESNNYTLFNQNLEFINQKTASSMHDKIGKYFLLLYCVRNFVGHQYILRNAHSEFIFNKNPITRLYEVESIFWKIFASLFYIYQSRTART